MRQVHEQLSETADLHFNTVQTQLRIMDDKGLVRHRRDGRTMIYQPLYSRDQESARFLQRVFDGELDQLVLSMLASEKLSSKDLSELEEIVAQARRNKSKRRQTKKGK